MILFTQSTAVLHKYLNDELKYFVTIFPDDAQNSLNFPCSEKSLSIPGFPGLWPPCVQQTQNQDKANGTNNARLNTKLFTVITHLSL